MRRVKLGSDDDDQQERKKVLARAGVADATFQALSAHESLHRRRGLPTEPSLTKYAMEITD